MISSKNPDRWCKPSHLLLVRDFLAPRLLWQSTPHRHVSHISNSESPAEASSPPPPKARRPLSQAQRDFLSSALRVNQAGELAATLIYTGQLGPLSRSHPHVRPLLQHMHDQEAGHLRTFNALLAHHRVRPTLLRPVWRVAATALGWGTAMLGREAAMACTEAVETEIGEHYNGQVRVLLEMMREMRETGEEMGEELVGLLETVRRIRDEELEQ
ncbi:MAG: hypothetical protein M1829_005564 [Trizodia sp. TS-e1964]|nr:MAG: hypothetical protein M1829_005564 [Trizodia sp. TS-e1964]